MMPSFIKRFFDPSLKLLQQGERILPRVRARASELSGSSQQELQDLLFEARARLRDHADPQRELVEVYAIIVVACDQLADAGAQYEINDQAITWVMRPYDVQIIGATILSHRAIAEMKTGEGKTLVVAFPVILMSLLEKGVHVVTVNDYLAKRDATIMGTLYAHLGLTVGVNVPGMTREQKQEAYAADITYGTNNEFGFDYLRDNMARQRSQLVQRDLAVAFVDEVDSILIDESRTPLIISAPAGADGVDYGHYSSLVRQLTATEHYLLDEKRKSATLTDAGIARLESLMGVQNIYSEAGFAEVQRIEQALRAQAAYHRDQQYVVQDGEVVLVDEFTGRLMPGRRLSEGLHQAIEAKEGVTVKEESRTLATITFQNYFRLYDHLAGMTGTAKTEEEELLRIYNLEVAVVPTHRPLMRQDLSDLIYQTEQAKFQAIAAEVQELHEQGRPVLIGTVSIEKSEALSRLLHEKGLSHQVLNAKQHEQESRIIANAGQKSSITIATNMAGRGTDIKLGEGVSEVGGLAIIGSERHESRRIDNQLRGRAGRQGDPGSTRFYLSLEDTLMRLFGSDRLKSLMSSLNVPLDLPLENPIITRSIEGAQKKVEGHHFDIRKHVVQYDDVMNRQRTIIYARRRQILAEADIHEEYLQWIENVASRFMASYIEGRQRHDYDTQGLSQSLDALIPPDVPSAEAFESEDTEQNMRVLVEQTLRQAFSEKAESVQPPEIFSAAERQVALRVIDRLWMEHITVMTRLREEVSLRSYAQKNPLQEYQSDGYELFRSLLAQIEYEALRTILHVQIRESAPALPAQPAPTEAPLETNAAQIASALSSQDFSDAPAPRPTSGRTRIVAEPGSATVTTSERALRPMPRTSSQPTSRKDQAKKKKSRKSSSR